MSETNQTLNSGVFPDVQTNVRNRLASFSQFGGLRMVLQQDGNVDSKIETALATMGDETTRAGVALLIAVPSVDDPTNSVGIKLDPFQVTVSVIEDTMINEGEDGTGRRAVEWAVMVWATLKGWTPEGCHAPLMRHGKAISLVATKGMRVGYTVSMKTKINIPLIRHPGENGYTDTEPPEARI